MNEPTSDWIDPASARKLLLEYQQALGTTGASQIERELEKHTKEWLSRKTIENWLKDPDSKPHPETLRKALLFLKTPHFQRIVSRTKHYLDADARLSHIGSAFLNLFGPEGSDMDVLVKQVLPLAGWWTAQKLDGQVESGVSYIYISPIAGRAIAKFHVSLRTNDIPEGSGILFPKWEGEGFSARIWSKRRYRPFREKVLTLIYFSDPNWSENKIRLLYEPLALTADSVKICHADLHPAKVSDVPSSVQEEFDQWDREVIPRGLAEQSFSV